MTKSHGNALLVICGGNPPVAGGNGRVMWNFQASVVSSGCTNIDEHIVEVSEEGGGSNTNLFIDVENIIWITQMKLTKIEVSAVIIGLLHHRTNSRYGKQSTFHWFQPWLPSLYWDWCIIVLSYGWLALLPCHKDEMLNITCEVTTTLMSYGWVSKSSVWDSNSCYLKKTSY